MDPADGFGQEDGDVDGLDLVALQLLQVVRNSVCHDNLKKKPETKSLMGNVSILPVTCVRLFEICDVLVGLVCHT